MATTRIATRRVREDQVFTSHSVTKKEGQVSRARLGLEVLVVPSCSYVTENSIISNILITAAGFHVVLLSHKLKAEKTC